MSESKSFHMSPEEFRRQGHAVVDWIADYQSRVESFPVLSRVQPGEIRSKLPPNAPAHGEAFDQILADIERVILPGITHWQSPNFFAYFPGERLRAWHSRRSALLRTGRARHALVHQSGVHRTGNARARLAGPHAGLAGEISFDQQRRRRRDSGHRVQRLALRLAGRARACHAVRQQPQRLRWTPGRLLLHANTFLR